MERPVDRGGGEKVGQAPEHHYEVSQSFQSIDSGQKFASLRALLSADLGELGAEHRRSRINLDV